MFTKVLDTIAKYNMISKGDRVLAALSGGADSVALLHILNALKERLGFGLAACHINHQLRGGEAGRDARFCEELCASLGVELVVKNACVREHAEAHKQSIELAAREMRYALLFEVAGGAKIATAHTLSDSVETALFNLARGTAAAGARGIPAMRQDRRGEIIRPLVDCTRAEVEAYCGQNGLQFVTDSTNLSDIYTRNRLRLRVIPELRTVNPSFEAAFSRFFAAIGQQDDYIAQQAAKALGAAALPNGRLDAKRLNSLHEAVKTRALTMFFEQSGLDCDYKKILLLCGILKTGGALSVAKNIDIAVKDGELFLKRQDESAAQKSFCLELKTGRMVINEAISLAISHVELENNEKIKLLSKKLLKNSVDCDRIKGNLFVRSRQTADRVSFFGRDGTKTLKKLFIDEKIPAELRACIPVVADDDGILWVGGFGTARHAALSENTKAYYSFELLTTDNKLLTFL